GAVLDVLVRARVGIADEVLGLEVARQLEGPEPLRRTCRRRSLDDHREGEQPERPSSHYFRHSSSTGRMSDPGPGSPGVASTVLAPSHTVPTSVPVPVFGYVGSGHCGTGIAGVPTRTIEPPPAVGKHGRVESVEQQSWLTPPFASMHCPSDIVWHAPPVHVASQVPPRQASSCAWPGHGFDPDSIDVPGVSGAVIAIAPAGVPAGGQSEDSVNRWFPGAVMSVSVPSVRHACPFRLPPWQMPDFPMSEPEQRGQSSVGVVTYTSLSRCTVACTAPVARSAVPSVTLGLANRMTTQVGATVNSGSGGPNVAPFT